LTDANMVKQFLMRPELYKKYDIDFWDKVNIKATLFSEGEEWKVSRKIATSTFTFDNVKGAIPTIIQSTLDSFDEWDKQMRFCHLAVGMFHDISGEVILRHWFGTSHLKYKWEGNQTLTDMIKLFLDEYGEASSSFTATILGYKFVKLGLLDSHKRFLKRKQDLRKYGQQLINQAIKDGVQEHTLLAVMLREKASNNKYYDDEKILNEFLDFLVAGADSISHMLGFTLYYLMKQPEKLAKVKAEIERELSDIENVTIDNLNRMEYCHAALKESLRIAPEGAFMIAREALEDHTIGDLCVRKGDLVNAINQTFHMSEEYYTNPYEYCPERWLADGPYPNDGWKKETYSFLTFLGGPRLCPGQHLAMIEGKIILGLFLKRYNYKIPQDYELKMMQAFSYVPLEPFYMEIEPLGVTSVEE